MKTRHHLSTVVFDLGGVLIDWNPRYLYRKLFDDNAGNAQVAADLGMHAVYFTDPARLRHDLAVIGVMPRR